jgi:hypothetical protein
MHIEELLYHCDVCHQIIPLHLTLNSHPRIQSTKQLHRMCSKPFKSRSVLNTHLCIHNTKFLYSCGCVKCHLIIRVFWRDLNTYVMISVHMAVLCALSVSVTSVIWRCINRYMLATVHVNVMHVISFINNGTLKKHKVIQSWAHLFSCDVCNKRLIDKMCV